MNHAVAIYMIERLRIECHRELDGLAGVARELDARRSPDDGLDELAIYIERSQNLVRARLDELEARKLDASRAYQRALGQL